MGWEEDRAELKRLNKEYEEAKGDHAKALKNRRTTEKKLIFLEEKANTALDQAIALAETVRGRLKEQQYCWGHRGDGSLESLCKRIDKKRIERTKWMKQEGKRRLKNVRRTHRGESKKINLIKHPIQKTKLRINRFQTSRKVKKKYGLFPHRTRRL